MLWRFFPTLDPQVDVFKTQKSIFMSRKVLGTFAHPPHPQVDLFMSRDLDSAPTQRPLTGNKGEVRLGLGPDTAPTISLVTLEGEGGEQAGAGLAQHAGGGGEELGCHHITSDD